jgi:nitronate monooxygenase
MHTRPTELFGIDHPILCAPMGGVAGGALAAAVARAGVLGLIGSGLASRRLDTVVSSGLTSSSMPPEMKRSAPVS